MATRRHLPAMAAYAAMTAVVLWPAVVHFSSRPMVDVADGSVFRWIWWAMPRALGRGDNPYATDQMFHPVGADLATTTSAPLVSALTWPLQALLGPAAQVNAVQLAGMFVAAGGAYLLAHHVTHDRCAAFLAGAAWALLPHRFAHVASGHLNLVHLGLVPLLVLAFLRALDRPDRGRIALLGIAAGCTFLVDPQLVILALVAIVPLAVVHRSALAGAWRPLAAAGALAAVVAAPLLVPLAAAMLAGESGEPIPTGASMVYAASPLSWVVPPLEQLWLGRFASLEPPALTPEGIAYPGAVVIALALAGRRLRTGDERRGWVAMAIVGIVLSLGPYPYVRDTYVEVPLPFFVVRALPGFDAFRVPGRFAVVGALGLVVLAAMALAVLLRRYPRCAGTATALALGLVLVELLPRSLPEAPADAPAPYRAIADHPDPGAVLEIPIQWSTGQRAIGYAPGRREDFLFLVNATVHERATVSGAASRYPEDRLAELLGTEAYRQVLALQGEPGFDDAATFDREDLAALGIGFVAYDRREPAPLARAYIERLGLTVLADDGAVIVWLVGR